MSESPALDDKVILAAGGVVERLTPDGIEIAVIHRTRHGGEWSLPKGKVKAGESWEQAALREVKEETGCDVHLGKFAGSTQYCTDGNEKHVFFWQMRASSRANFRRMRRLMKFGGFHRMRLSSNFRTANKLALSGTYLQAVWCLNVKTKVSGTVGLANSSLASGLIDFRV